ncbi:MAG: single-stranded-DNA-specific exonuclease RecJ, partial [Lachnospiraceae bacterium]|nr:single-stranded-DNA-specific exonuclease RecJ [Lachnospiraceae bacterium]
MLGDATEAVDLLKFDGPYEKARVSAMKLVEINNRRKEQTQIAYRKLKEAIDSSPLKDQAPIVAYLPGISEGLIGILAGKVAEEYQVPAIILSDSS